MIDPTQHHQQPSPTRTERLMEIQHHHDEPTDDDGHHHPLTRSARSSTTLFHGYVFSMKFMELVACLIPFILSMITEFIVQPNQRPIPYQYLESTGDYIVNQIYNQTYEGETVSSLALVVGCCILPYALQIIICYSIKRICSTLDIYHNTTCVYFIGIGLTGFITNSIKLYVGYLRPIFYDLCQPDENYESCTSNDHDVRLSFPSGHASLSVCGMMLLSQFFYRAFGIHSLLYYPPIPTTTTTTPMTGDQHHDDIDVDVETPSTNDQHSMSNRSTARRNSNVPKAPTATSPAKRIISVLCYSPMLVAFFVAASRVRDNKHFPADVVGGSLLGGSISVLVFSVWFPSLVYFNQ
jgi:membrane-associated phospholipid phosphatase